MRSPGVAVVVAHPPHVLYHPVQLFPKDFGLYFIGCLQFQIAIGRYHHYTCIDVAYTATALHVELAARSYNAGDGMYFQVFLVLSLGRLPAEQLVVWGEIDKLGVGLAGVG